MTRPEKTGVRNLDFSRWLRTHLKDSYRGLIIQDLDWIVVNYCTGWFILLEQKVVRGRARQITSPAQTVILRMLDELLQRSAELNRTQAFSRNPATGAAYEYLGLFLLEFVDGTSPDNSSGMLLNGKPISRADLIRLLNLDSQASRELLARYRSDWLERNLSRQRTRLRGNCEETGSQEEC